MPRYFFHTEDGQCFPDEIGTELANLAAAQREAVKILGQLIKDDPDLFLQTEAFRVIIQDETGLTLYLIDVTGVRSPAAMVARSSVGARRRPSACDE
jgi:hypothetical protein